MSLRFLLAAPRDRRETQLQHSLSNQPTWVQQHWSRIQDLTPRHSASRSPLNVAAGQGTAAVVEAAGLLVDVALEVEVDDPLGVGELAEAEALAVEVAVLV